MRPTCFALTLVTSLVFLPAAATASELATQPVDEACLLELLGDGWEKNRSWVLWEPGDLDEVPESERPLAEGLLEMMGTRGVDRAIELSYTRVDSASDLVSLKVFNFTDPAKADAYRQRKYEHPQAAAYYEKSEQGDTLVYDSTQANKRIVFRDTLWITSSQLDDAGLHLRMIDCVAGEPSPAP